MSKPPRTPPAKSAPEPQRSNRARAVADLLPEVAGAAFRKFGFVQHAIVSRWSEIVGERYARVSAPQSIRFPAGKRSEGVLTLTVAGAFAPTMQHVAPEIVERVNRFFGYPAVAKLAIRQGELKPRAVAPAPAPPAPIPTGVGEGLRAIVDPELKAVLEALAAGIAAPVPKLGRID